MSRKRRSFSPEFKARVTLEALTRYGVSGIFNTGHGPQFISREFTPALKDAGARISIAGRGRWPNIKMSSFQRERPLRNGPRGRSDPQAGPPP